MLLLHGAEDDDVLPANSTELARLLTEAGATAQAIIYDDVDHIDIVVAIGLKSRGKTVGDMVRFMEQVSSDR